MSPPSSARPTVPRWVTRSDSAVVRHARILAHVILGSEDPPRSSTSSRRSGGFVAALKERGLRDRVARTRAAQVSALVLGWHLFGDFLTEAVGLNGRASKTDGALGDAVARAAQLIAATDRTCVTTKPKPPITTATMAANPKMVDRWVPASCSGRPRTRRCRNRLVARDDTARDGRPMAGSSSWPKLIVRGATPSSTARRGRRRGRRARAGRPAVARSRRTRPRATTGSTRYVMRIGTHRCSPANRTRPRVNVRPERRERGDATSWTPRVRFMSTAPSSRHRLADAVADRRTREDREAGGMRERGCARAPATGARLRSRRLRRAPARAWCPRGIGRPHQKSRPMNTATSSGASAVPTPSSALSTSTDESTLPGVERGRERVERGTVNPKPTPSADGRGQAGARTRHLGRVRRPR